ncbi:MAG: hypothetical protein ACK4E0_09225 [Chitinophagaceae bacterium]
MARIPQMDINRLSPSVKVALERHLRTNNGIITNTNLTLCHSLPALEVYMQWYVMYDEIENLLGKRMAALYALALSSTSESPLCTAVFRKLVAESGESADHLQLNRQEQALYQFGSAIAKYSGNISDYVYNAISVDFKTNEMVLLIAFAGMMVATNIFNNTAETNIDSHLAAYVQESKFHRKISL